MMKPHYNETNKQTNKQTNQQKETYFIRISCVSPQKCQKIHILDMF